MEIEKSRIWQAYERAEKLMPWKMKDCVLNGEPEPVWIEDDVFYYSRQSRMDGMVRTDFVCHDTRTQEEWPLFDADAVAELLGEKVLPFREASVREGVLYFTVNGYDYKYQGSIQTQAEAAADTAAQAAEITQTAKSTEGAGAGKTQAAKGTEGAEIEKRQAAKSTEGAGAGKTQDAKATEGVCAEKTQAALTRLGCHRQQVNAVAPDGTREIFVKGHNLYLRDLADGREQQLTFDGEADFEYGAEAEQINVVRERLAGIAPEVGVLWSHNSRKFLTYKLDMRGVKEFYILRSFDKEGRESIRPELLTYKCSLPEDDRVPLAYLYLCDADSGKMIRIDAPPIAAGHFVLNRKYEMAQWLEDDSQVYYTSTGRGDKDGAFHVIDAEDGSVRTIVREHSDEFLNLGTYGRYDGFGAYPYSNFLTSDQRYVFWQSEREDKARIYRYEAQTGELHNAVTPENSIAGVLMHKDEAEEWLYYMANDIPGVSDPYYHVLCRVHFDGTGFEILTPEDGEHTVTMGKHCFIDTWSRVDRAPLTVVRSLDGSLLCTLAEADISALLEKGYQMPERFSVTASDGKTELYGILIRPADFEPDRKYPVIDYVYGGMQCCNVPKAFTWQVMGGREIMGGLESFAQLGFAGIILDGLGTPGRGKVLHNISYENIHGCAGLKDHVTCRQELQEKYPFLDFTRTGVWGNSGGGCATVRAMLEYPDDFQAGVSSAGNHDQRMYDNMWTERYYGLYKPEIYKKGDNTALAANLKGKLYIIHGAMDCNVSSSESIRLIDALIKEDKDFDFLTLPRTNHNVPGNPYFIRKKLDYFVKHLLKEELPKGYHFAVSNIT